MILLRQGRVGRYSWLVSAVESSTSYGMAEGVPASDFQPPTGEYRVPGEDGVEAGPWPAGAPPMPPLIGDQMPYMGYVPVSASPLGASYPYASSGAPPPPVLQAPHSGAGIGDPWAMPFPGGLAAPIITDRIGDRETAREVLAWSLSPERKRAVRAIVSAILLIIIPVMVLLVIDNSWLRRHHPSRSAAGLAVLLIVVPLVRLAYRRQRRLFRMRRSLEEQPGVAAGPGSVAFSGLGGERRTADGPLELEKLWFATQQRLDYYHQIATFQAETSFRNAQVAMVAGFVLVVTTLIVAMLARSTVGGVVAGALGGVGATMATFIGRTFVRAHETASSHLRSYFVQPLEISRVLAAVHILDGVPLDQRHSALATIAECIARGPEVSVVAGAEPGDEPASSSRRSASSSPNS